MIIGVGTDLADLGRIERLLSGERGDAFLKRMLTEEERQLAQSKSSRKHRLIEFAAGRWAAKEAVVKALGCGIGGLVGLQDIEVLPDELGKPGCTVREEAWLRLGYGPDRIRPVIHLSITHSGGAALAFAVAELIRE